MTRTYSKNIIIVPRLLGYTISIFHHFLAFFIFHNSVFQLKNLKRFPNMCTDNRHASEFFQNFSSAGIGEIRQKPDFLFLPFTTLRVEIQS